MSTGDQPKIFSRKFSYLLTALSGICGQLALGVYYSGLLVPRELMIGNVSSAQLTELITHNQIAIFWDAYLQGIGSVLTVIFFIRLLYISGVSNRFLVWMVLIASSIVLSMALADVTFTLAGVNAALARHTETMRIAFDFVAGSTEVFDYTFLFVPAPLLIISIAMVLLASDLLPRIFGYAAILIGVAFVTIGICSLFTTLAGPTGVAFEAVQLTQVVWVLGSSIVILIYGMKKRGR